MIDMFVVLMVPKTTLSLTNMDAKVFYTSDFIMQLQDHFVNMQNTEVLIPMCMNYLTRESKAVQISYKIDSHPVHVAQFPVGRQFAVPDFPNNQILFKVQLICQWKQKMTGGNYTNPDDVDSWVMDEYCKMSLPSNTDKPTIMRNHIWLYLHGHLKLSRRQHTLIGVQPTELITCVEWNDYKKPAPTSPFWTNAGFRNRYTQTVNEW